MDSWKKQEILSIVKMEYQSMRTEIMTSLNQQYVVLAFGVPLIMTVFASGFYVWDGKPVLAISIFAVIIPFIIGALLLYYANQVARMYRAGNYIYEFIEKKIEAILGPDYRELLPNVKNNITCIDFNVHESNKDDEKKATLDRDRTICQNAADEIFRSILGWQAWLRSEGYRKIVERYEPWNYFPLTQRTILWIWYGFFILSIMVAVILTAIFPYSIIWWPPQTPSYR